MTQSAEKYY